MYLNKALHYLSHLSSEILKCFRSTHCLWCTPSHQKCSPSGGISGKSVFCFKKAVMPWFRKLVFLKSLPWWNPLAGGQQQTCYLFQQTCNVPARETLFGSIQTVFLFLKQDQCFKTSETCETFKDLWENLFEQHVRLSLEQRKSLFGIRSNREALATSHLCLFPPLLLDFPSGFANDHSELCSGCTQSLQGTSTIKEIYHQI